MGEPKASLELAGRPLISYPIAAVRAAGLQPVVVAKVESVLPGVDCTVVAEQTEAAHPAAGILAALEANEGGPVVVLPCDTPFVPPELVDHLARLDTPVAVPRVAGRLQPLLARYSAEAAGALAAALELDDALHKAIERLDPLIVEQEDVARFGDPETIAFNVNDRDDLAAAEGLLAATPST